jgi:uncharacterized LabA/DUF88 family protein
MAEKVALLIDGGFAKKKLQAKTKRFPTVKDVVDLAAAIMAKPKVSSYSLFRIYFYDAPPYDGTAKNPIDGSTIKFAGTPHSIKNQALLQALELQPDFAVRRGTLGMRGWKLGSAAMKSIAAAPRPVAPADLVPDIQQKGVDMRIGLDIASLALKRIVAAVVLVTGDSDFVPAMKFARREGIRVYLETLEHGVRLELKAHADIVL